VWFSEKKNRSTIDQIFTVRQILEKCYEYDVDIHMLFVDFKQAYDSVYRKKLIEILYSFGIPGKLVRLIEISLTHIRGKVVIQGLTTDYFKVDRGLKQGDVTSTILFNIVLEYVKSRLTITPKGNMFNMMTQCIAYADDIVLLGRSVNYLKEILEELKQGAKKVGLEINQDKTKYMIMTGNKDKWQRVQDFTSGEVSYERVDTFEYLGSVLNEENYTGLEIRSRVMAGNKCYYALGSIMRSKSISRKSKLKIYRTVIKPIVIYASETWVLKEKGIIMLNVWGKKNLRKIFGAKKEGNEWKIRNNQELRNTYVWTTRNNWRYRK
jgi:sorting nexin-29